MSPTQRSLAYLREQGMTCEVVERWNAFARIRQDLFGIIDIVALDEQQTLGVQTTSWTNVSARVKKIADSPHLPALLRAGWVLEVHGWKKGLSTPKIVRL
jgi:carbonic anhydrase